MNLEKATIAVTGATGFLGGYLVRALAERGVHTVAVVRNREKAARVLSREVELRIADLSDRAALRDAFVGVDAVISNAAVVSYTEPRETMRTNVEGTRNVFTALGEAGVKRAIAISSSAAYPMSLRSLDEQQPLRALKRIALANSYGESKAEAERVAWQLAQRYGVGLTTFRPCGISGPFDPLLMATIERVMRLPIAPFPAFTTIGVVHAADVADAVLRALSQPIASGQAYNLQGCTATLWQIADAWRRAGGRSPLARLPIPVPVSLRYEDAKARRELHWQPRSLDAIVEEAVHARRNPGVAPELASQR